MNNDPHESGRSQTATTEVSSFGRRPRTPVMADVARLAGVSHQTVSRVLNGHPNVSAPARESVLNAIAQLGYRRNVAARALVSRRMMTLGVVSVDTSHYGPASTLFGIAEAARSAGYYLSLATLKQIDRASMKAALDHLVMGVDGVIVIAPVAAAVQAVQGFNSDVPLMMLHAPAPGEEESVFVDQVLGARLATRHLLDLGHQTVAHVSGPEDWFESDSRIRGWRAELSAANSVALEIVRGDWTAESGYAAGKVIARRGDAAVFVANDQMALGLIKALRDMGRTVPGDISVVGFDDIPEAAFIEPALTTVRQDFDEVGRRCIAQILSLIDSGERRVRELIRPTLVVRASTAPPGAAGLVAR